MTTEFVGKYCERCDKLGFDKCLCSSLNRNNYKTFSRIILLLRDLAQAEQHNHPARVGAALAAIKMVYGDSDIVIFRCQETGCDNKPFYASLDEVQEAQDQVDCEYCGKSCARLLSNGSWQSQAERYAENAKRYERVAR